MCGIAGLLGPPDRSGVLDMMRAMTSRGPDDSGLKEDPPVTLGHRRLSILDLSEAGRQPMSRADSRLWIVYNGEVYNFKDLRRDLEARGHRFRSRTDTEVILALYQEMGTDCVSRLRGMFAFAIWDRRGNEPFLFLARDQFGIKPLVYSSTADRFVFASDLPGIMASGHVERDVDRVALLQYLLHGHVVQPRTIMKDVHMLPAGHAMKVRPGDEPRVWKYWDLNHDRSSSLSAGLDFGGQAERVRELLLRAARVQMVSDVPLGAFLSGGIDSCALAALMMKVSERPVHTYSIGFAGAGVDLDESQVAQRSAAHLGAIHLNVPITGRDVEKDLPSIAMGLGQPTVDGVNMYFVSRAARTGVTVALTGLGSDEMFAGYRSVGDLSRAWAGGNAGRRALASTLGRSGLWRILPRSPLRETWELRTLGKDLPSDYMISHMIRSPSEAMRLGGSPAVDPGDLFAYRRDDDPDVEDVISRIGRLDSKLYMCSQLLRDADAASMVHSLEVRVPFLDVDLAEFAYGLPGESKIAADAAPGAQAGKRVLVEAVRDLLPPWTYGNPKRGFAMPFGEWLGGPLRRLAEEVLTDRGFRSSGLLDGQEIDRVWKRFHAGHRDHWTRVWSVLILALWWQGWRTTVPVKSGALEMARIHSAEGRGTRGR